MNSTRKIIHIDMDAFYASVEQRDNPELRGKPIAVGGGSKRGVTTTASYEARAFGVRSAMPGFKAKRLCPELIFVSPRFDVYKEVSRQIRAIFREFTDVVEPLSLDEAFLDVTDNKSNDLVATRMAREIKDRIYQQTQLTCSAGVSYCKFLAKVASGMNKPDGLTVVKPAHAFEFIGNLPIDQFFGVGKVTAQKMKSIGIHNGADLRKWSKKYLIQRFGKPGAFFYNVARGIDERAVQPDRTRKSIGVERTLENDLDSVDAMEREIHRLAGMLMDRMEKASDSGRTLTLKVKSSDFKILTRSRTFAHYLRDREALLKGALTLLRDNTPISGKIRLMGLTISNLEREQACSGKSDQMTLF